MKQILKNEWANKIEGEFTKEYYQELRQFLKSEYANNVVYPDMHDIFNAFHYTDYNDVKVVILGQDPYHGVGQAHGLSFSVRQGITPPPSLKNIYKELNRDLGLYIPNNGELTKWAKQGVMMLNTVLTVRDSEAGSHRNKGWESFTDEVIKTLNNREEPIIFMLWGSYAKSKAKLITNKQHYLLQSSHPSPLSVYRGFDGCGHFGKCNEILESMSKSLIDWQIENV